MRFGLEEHIVDSIISIFEEHSKVDKAYVFGSRAKGNYRPDSDIDIAIKGQELTTDDIISMAVAFEADGVTYKIDLIDYNNIKEPELKAHIDRVGIEFYSRWKEYTLGEITHKITDGAHLSPKDYPNGKIMFSVKDMTETGFDYSTPKTISQEDFDNLIKQGCQPDIDDVLIAKDGSVLKHIFRVTTKPDYVLLSSIAIVKPKKEIVDASFLVYTLKNPKITETILNNFVSGSGVPRIVLKDFKKVNISLPPLSEQRAISSILSSLDDKIDLLQRQNKTLEQLAETLFRQWFIEEADESWEEKRLSELLTITSSKRIFYSEYVPSGVPFYRSKEIIELRNTGSTNSELFIKEDRFREIESKFGAPVEGDILMTSVGTLGVAYRVRKSDRFYFKDGNLTWFKNFSGLPSSIVYLWLISKVGQEQLDSIKIGSTQEAFTIEGLKSITFKIPPANLILEYDLEFRSIIDKIEFNQSQILTLTKTRDTLLPKIMSGEVRVLETSSMLY